jgi:hypothetical protein
VGEGDEQVPIGFEEFVLELDPSHNSSVYQCSLKAWRKHSMTSISIRTPNVAKANNKYLTEPKIMLKAPASLMELAIVMLKNTSASCP